MVKAKEMTEKDWPSDWPSDPIPTKPCDRPYFSGDFQLHVWPEEFKIPHCLKDKIFYFRIKNPTSNTIKYLVQTRSFDVIGEDQGPWVRHGAASAVLKPMEISKPIGLKPCNLEKYSKGYEVIIGYQVQGDAAKGMIEESPVDWVDICMFEKPIKGGHSGQMPVLSSVKSEFGVVHAYFHPDVYMDPPMMFKEEKFEEWEPVEKEKSCCVIM